MSEAPKEIWCSMGLYYDYKKELEAENKRLRLEAAHANDTADAAIEHMKEMEAIIDYQNKRSETLAEGWRITEDACIKLEAKLAKAVELALEECPFRWGTPNYDNWWRHRRTTLAELKGENDE
jgi:hypothetical protein